MATIEKVLVPDIGDFENVEIIEILVSPGDPVAAEQSLITLESDKASMEIPSPGGGTVKKLLVAIGDRVSEGSPILELETESASDQTPESGGPGASERSEPGSESEAKSQPGSAAKSSQGTAPTEPQSLEVNVPDIGDFSDVEIIEVLVAPGDTVQAEQSLITLESDKASMEVPSPRSGTVLELKCKTGDRVSEGSPILLLRPDGGAGNRTDAADTGKPASAGQDGEGTVEAAAGDETPRSADHARPSSAPSEAPTAKLDSATFRKAHASPAVRRFARELGADINAVSGTGPKGRILKEDVKAWVKRTLGASKTASTGATGAGIPPIPEIDFGEFGEVEIADLPRIKRISGPHLHRAWLNLPMVTHHDEADITQLEEFRKSLKGEAEQRGVRITALVFLLKAVVDALRTYPQFNASLTGAGQQIAYKKYFHVGIAVDTPNGLVVPVIRDVDSKGIYALSEEMATLSKKARDGKLKPNEMQGGCISISSLGGIGGTAFTPIVNAPEVAILGVTRARMMPVWDGHEFQPRLMLPLDLTYDHRVIDGADAARFCAHLSRTLGDVRRLLL